MNFINFVSIFCQYLLIFYYLIKFHNYIYVVIFKFDNLFYSSYLNPMCWHMSCLLLIDSEKFLLNLLYISNNRLSLPNEK